MTAYMSIQRLLSTTIIVALLLIVSGCTSTAAPQGAGGGVADPRGTKWTLVSYGPPDSATTALPDTITAIFEDGKISGSGGCNQYSGSYTVSGTSFTVTEVASTLMACEAAGVMQQEAAYTAALGTATSLSIEGDTLTIEYAGGVLRFTRMA